MIEVFRTNIPDLAVAHSLSKLLQQEFAGCRVAFDLEDCDRVLKVSAAQLNAAAISQVVRSAGFVCEVME